jgi:WD40 repeat protein
MEKINNNQAFSQLDQAYQSYKDEILERVVGIINPDELAGRISRGEISRDQIRELKSEIISRQSFRSYYYPRELSEKIKIKDNYDDKLICSYDGAVYDFQVLPSGDIISSGANGVIVISKRMSDGEFKNKVLVKSGPTALVIHSLPDGRILFGFEDGSIELWAPGDDGDYQHIGLKGVGESVYNICVSHDNRLFCSDVSGKIQAPGKLQWETIGDIEVMVTSMQLLPDRKLVSVGKHGCVDMWIPHDGKFFLKTVSEENEEITNLQVMIDGRIFFTTTDGLINVLEPEDNTLNYNHGFVAKSNNQTFDFQVLSDGRMFSASSEAIWLWELDSNREYKERKLKGIKGITTKLQVLNNGDIVRISGNKLKILK